jgi:hypothetical protein
MPRSPIRAGGAGKTRRLQQQHREHDDRRHALELVDEDRDRNSAVAFIALQQAMIAIARCSAVGKAGAKS